MTGKTAGAVSYAQACREAAEMFADLAKGAPGAAAGAWPASLGTGDLTHTGRIRGRPDVFPKPRMEASHVGFVEREMARLEAAIVEEPLGSERFRQLFAAQQALKWATEPQTFAAPLDSIDGKAGQAAMSSLEAIAGCLAESHPVKWSDTSATSSDVA